MYRLGNALVVFAGLILFVPGVGRGSHGEASVSDIDGDFGNSLGAVTSSSYTHSGTDHPWFTFQASAGDKVSFLLETDFTNGGSGIGSFLWLYEVIDGNVNIGDSSLGGQLTLWTISDNTDTPPGPYVDQSILDFVIPTTNQYIVQVDSWLGASGAYDLTYRRLAVPEPSTWALAVMGFAAMAAMVRRRRTQ